MQDPFSSDGHNSANALPLLHQCKGMVDLRQTHGAGNEQIEGDVTVHGLGDESGQLTATTHPAKCGTPPSPPR
jgi:hypothetical protein